MHEPLGVRKGQGADEDMVRDREGGRDGADPEGGKQDGRRRESGRAPQHSKRVARVLAQDVHVRTDRVDEDVAEHAGPQGDASGDARRIAASPGEDRAHLVAVLGTKRRGEGVEQDAVEAHQAFFGAKPLARTSFSSAASRLASARATAVPNGVIP